MDLVVSYICSQMTPAIERSGSILLRALAFTAVSIVVSVLSRTSKQGCTRCSTEKNHLSWLQLLSAGPGILCAFNSNSLWSTGLIMSFSSLIPDKDRQLGLSAFRYTSKYYIFIIQVQFLFLDSVLSSSLDKSHMETMFLSLLFMSV